MTWDLLDMLSGVTPGHINIQQEGFATQLNQLG